MKNNKNGFALVQVLLIVGILVIIAGAVYYVVKANKDVDRALTADSSIEATKKSALTSDAKKEEPKKTEAAPDITVSWKTFTESAGIYEFKHPTSWTFADNPSACSEGTVLFGVNVNSTGKCASDFSGQMAVFVFDGDLRADLVLIPPGYKDTTSADIKISGLDATKHTGVFSSDSEALVGPAGGDKIIRYMIFKNGKTYTINYYDLKANNFPDATADLETLVIKTFRFK